jgi:hypothetical protein
MYFCILYHYVDLTMLRMKETHVYGLGHAAPVAG